MRGVKHKLFNRLFLTMAAVMLVSVTVIMIILSFFAADYFTKEKKSLLIEGCKTVSEFCADNTDSADFADLFLKISPVISKSSDSDVFITDADGRVLACSCSNWRKKGSCIHSLLAIDRSLLFAAGESPYFELGNLKGSFSELYYTAITPVKANGAVTGYVFSIASASSLKSFYGHLRRMYVFSAMLPIIIMLVAQYLATYRLIRPLRQMSQAALCMSKGDFSRRIPVTSNDEMGELAVAFNQMTNSLARLEGTRRSFVANVSHELKTPMTTISGFVDGIIDGTIPAEKQPFYLQIISDETKRLSRVVQSMLSLAKLESGNSTLDLHRFDMASLVCAVVVAREQSITQKNIEIQGLDALQPIFVRADRDLIYQVVYNLVDNAVKFTSKGGYIDFSVCAVSGGVCVKVKNSGRGISRDELPYIFERFYKADKSRSESKNSNGLGLYLAKTIVNLHGGTISVNSKENEFVEFEFTLPSGNEVKA